MFMYFLQDWFWMLLFFLLGALVAWVIVRTMYRPIDEVRDEFVDTMKEVRR